MARKHKQRDPLYRGDLRDAVRLPVPHADRSFVRHVLQLEGPGMTDSPFLSTSEDRTAGQHFASRHGRVWTTTGRRLAEVGATDITHGTLIGAIKRGTGPGAWPSASERQRARAYAMKWREHLADFSAFAAAPDDLAPAVTRAFT